jgi:hypothetical protein
MLWTAEHMAAPTNAAFVKITLANSEPSTPPKAEVEHEILLSRTTLPSIGIC